MIFKSRPGGNQLKQGMATFEQFGITSNGDGGDTEDAV
jgi:hypothetical protein